MERGGFPKRAISPNLNGNGIRRENNTNKRNGNNKGRKTTASSLVETFPLPGYPKLCKNGGFPFPRLWKNPNPPNK